MRNKILFLTIAFVALMVMPPGAQSAAAQTALSPVQTWLYHDSGECNSMSWGSVNTDQTPLAAVLFTDVGTTQVFAVKYYISPEDISHDYPFRLHIMSGSWVDIYVNEYTPDSPGWNTIDLSGEGIIVSGEFIVGMERYIFVDNPPGYPTLAPNLCGDYRYINSHSWWWKDYPDGEPSIDVGENLMIRAQIDRPRVPTLTSWGLFALILLLILTTIFIIHRRRKAVPA